MREILGDAIFWIAAVCCLVAQIAIVRSALSPHQPAPDHARVPRPRTGLEVAWTLLPALLLLGVFVLTWQAMHRHRVPAELRLSDTAIVTGAVR